MQYIRSNQSLSSVQLFATPRIAALQASLSITNSWSSLTLTSIESVMPSSHLILRRPLLLLPPIPPSIRDFSNESALRMRWPKYWSFSFSIIPSKEIPGLSSFRMDWTEMTCNIALSNSMKLWAIPCRATQVGWVMVESSDKTWSIGEGNSKPLHKSSFENPKNSMKRQKDMTLKNGIPRSVGAPYATGDQWRNNSRKNEGMEP